MRVDLPTPTRALAIGAHPDDIEFECGGTLTKWAAAGCVVSFLVATDGSKGTWDIGADPASLITRRQAEQNEAARRLGAIGEVRFLDQTDGELDMGDVSGLDLRGQVARIIRELRPDVVLGHDPWRRWRLHPDHRAAGWVTVDAVVAARDPHYFPEHGLPHHRPDSLLLFECEEPDIVESLSNTHVQAKIDALLAHESQFETTMVIDTDDDGSQAADFAKRVVAEARDHGRLAGVGLGEAFRLIDPSS